MNACVLICGDSFFDMLAQARKTRIFAHIPSAKKGSTPLISTLMRVLILLGESDFSGGAECGDIVGTCKTP
jgi:hypothetical protein